MKNRVSIELDSVVVCSFTITALSVVVALLFNLVYFCVVLPLWNFSVFVAVLPDLYFFVVVLTGNCWEFRPTGVNVVVMLHFIVPLIRFWCLMQLELLLVDVWCTYLAYNVVTKKVNNKIDNFIVTIMWYLVVYVPFYH